MIKINDNLFKYLKVKFDHFFLLIIIIFVLLITFFIINIQSYFIDLTYDSMNRQVSNFGLEIEKKINDIEESMIFDVSTGILNKYDEKNDRNLKRFLVKYSSVVQNIEVYGKNKVFKLEYKSNGYFNESFFKDENYILYDEIKFMKSDSSKYIIIPYINNLGDLVYNFKIKLDFDRIIKDEMEEFHINGKYWIWFISDDNIIRPIEYSESESFTNRFNISNQNLIKSQIQNGYKGFIKNKISYDSIGDVATSYYPIIFHDMTYGIGVSVYSMSIIKDITIKIGMLVFLFILFMLIIIFYFNILISNEKKIVKDLNESEESINKIIKYVPFGIILYDDGKIIKANSYAIKELELEDDCIESEIVNKLVDSKVENEGSVIKVKDKEGLEKSLLINLTFIKFKKKEVKFLSFIDVTIINEAKELAEESSRIKSRFVATVSHEIRTPMNGIIAAIDLLENMDFDNEEANNYIKIAKNSSKNLLSMINDILKVSTIEGGRLKLNNVCFNLREVLNSIFEQFIPLVDKKSIKYHMDIDEKLPKNLNGDENKLRQIIINLIGNSIKFTHNGEIYVKVEQKRREDKKITMGIRILDTGIGIPDDKLDDIFLKFVQVQDSNTRGYQGNGLGTTITKELVGLLDGNIKAISPNNEIESENRGAIFDVEIKMDVCGELVDEIEYTSIGNKEVKILLAEDNKVNAKVTKKILSNFGFDIDVAYNGQEAVDMFDKTYDLILMDIQMPVKDGFKATEEIREKDKDIEIIALTANDDQDIIKKVEDLKMNGLIVKPFSRKKINQIIKKFI